MLEATQNKIKKERLETDSDPDNFLGGLKILRLKNIEIESE